MADKAKPKVEPVVDPVGEPVVVSIPDGANEAGCQPPSFVGTCFDVNRCTHTEKEGE